MYEGPSRTSGYGDMNRFPLNATAGYQHALARGFARPSEHPYGTSSFAHPYGFARPSEHPYGTSSFAQPDEGFGRPHGTSSFARPHETSSFARPHETSSFARPHGTSSFARPSEAFGQRTAGYPYGFAHTDAFADFSRLSVN
jgi:hypothetical protein